MITCGFELFDKLLSLPQQNILLILFMQDCHNKRQTLTSHSGSLIRKVLCLIYQIKNKLINKCIQSQPWQASNFFQILSLPVLLGGPCPYHLLFNPQTNSLHPICCQHQVPTLVKSCPHILCSHLVLFLEWSERCRLEVGCPTLP